MDSKLPRITIVVMVVLTLSLGTGFGADARSLAEQLGYRDTEKILIVNGDDAGMCHAANLATIECLEQGIMRSATIMVACPWFPEIAAYAKQNPQKDFGVHLCHTSEWTKYRWGPVAESKLVPGLIDPEGYLWRGVQDVYQHAKPGEALIEGRAQIRRALAAGVDVTHLDSHMGTLQMHADYVQVYLELAVEFNLPVRMASQETLTRLGQPKIREQFAAHGIKFPDYFVYDELKDLRSGVKPFWLNIVKNLKPGVTELYIHAAQATDEAKAITGSWSTRAQEYELFAHDQDLKRLIEAERIILISYRPIRELQRSELNRRQAK